VDPDPDPRIHAYDFWIRIGCGSGFLLFKKKFYCITLFEGTFLHHFSKVKSQKEITKNSRNEGFSYHFCLMIEGSGSISLTNGSGSATPPNWLAEVQCIYNIFELLSKFKIDSMYESGVRQENSIGNGCFQKFSCKHRIGKAGEATQRAWAGTQSQERPRSSLVGPFRITGFGRTGRVMCWYMGGIITEEPRTEDDFSLIVC
jgi:hypothetical protein